MPADLVALLDTLRRYLVSLSSTDPYYRSRLLRITQQLDSVVPAWPPEDWPLSSPAPAHSLARQTRPHVPTRPQVLVQLQQLQETLRDEEQLSGCQQKLLDLLLCLF